MAREDDLAADLAEGRDQPLDVGDHGLGEARQVVAGRVRVPLRQHLPDPGIGVAAVVLHVDDEERRPAPVDLEGRPGEVPCAERRGGIDRRQLAHVRRIRATATGHRRGMRECTS